MANRGKYTREYALYKGDDLLAIGTLEELAETLGVTPNTIYYYSMSAYQRKGNVKKPTGKRIVAIKLED